MTSAQGERTGYTIYLNCYEDGTHDVFRGPLHAASEAEYPDGLFGLESVEDALKAVIALKSHGADYEEAEEAAMMQHFGEDSTPTRLSEE